MFQLFRRISGTFTSHLERVWGDDASSSAPQVGQKRRLSDDSDDYDYVSAFRKRSRVDPEHDGEEPVPESREDTPETVVPQRKPDQNAKEGDACDESAKMVELEEKDDARIYVSATVEEPADDNDHASDADTSVTAADNDATENNEIHSSQPEEESPQVLKRVFVEIGDISDADAVSVPAMTEPQDPEPPSNPSELETDADKIPTLDSAPAAELISEVVVVA